jgi:hypothetical protein
MLSVYVEGIGLTGPGLPDWTTASEILAGHIAYEPAPTAAPVIDLLPPAVSATVRLALQIAQAAIKAAGRDAAQLATVFASSGGDGDTIHNILETLATPTREVSPTRFHNSVHNAPSGYWALATECREPSTTLCAHDWSFGAGLLEGAIQAVAERRPVAVIAYDKAYPEPLATARPITDTFGVGLVLGPERTAHALARIEIAPGAEGAQESTMAGEAFERLRRGNPAARSLPLLRAIARGAGEALILDSAPRNSLALTVCAPDR